MPRRSSCYMHRDGVVYRSRMPGVARLGFARLGFMGLVLAAPVLTGFDCEGGTQGQGDSTTWTNTTETVKVTVSTAPFGIVIRGADGHVLIESTTPHNSADPADPVL